LWELFDALVDLPAEEQESELERLTAPDSDLRRELSSLLAKPPSEFMEQPLLSPEEGDFVSVLDAPLAPVGDPLIGQVLVGMYSIEARIGQGSMGVVYRGQHLKLKKRIAIKVLHDIGVSAEDLTRMVEEAATVASLRHENIVAVHDVGTHAGRAFMVMDWIQGVDLHGWLVHARERRCFASGSLGQAFRAYVESQLGRACSGPLWTRPYSEIATSIMRTIARAAEHAHEAGYIHRDIAPKNVLITSSGQPFLIDFGVATLSAEHVSQLSRETVKGTLEYVAPEQLDPETASRLPTVDVYGLGATLYHLLAGRQPFEGEPLQVFQQVLTSLPPDLRSVQPRVHRDLEAICFGAMEKRPQDRYASAGALADDLDAFLDRRPVSRRSPNWFGRTCRWCRRRPAVALSTAAVVCMLALALVAGGLVMKEAQRVEAADRQQLFELSFAALPLMVTLDSDGRYATAPFPARSDDDLGALWERLVELQPERPLLRWTYANWLSQRGELDRARRELEALHATGAGGPVLDALEGALLSTDPVRRNRLVAASSLPAPDSAFEFAIAGYVAIRQRQHALAYESLSRAIELEPSEWMYADLRSVAGLESASADLCLEDAVRVETELGVPTCRSLHVRAFLTRVTFPERADELWRLCLERGGDQHQPLHGRGELLYEAGRYAEARALLRRAAELKPSSWRTYLLISRCAEAEGAFDEAEAALVEGMANLAPGRPAGGFEPLGDLQLEQTFVLRSWAHHLARSGALEDARARLEQARARLAELGSEASLWRTGLGSELDCIELVIKAGEHSRDPEDTLRRMRQLHLAYLRTSGEDPEPSTLISLDLGSLLMSQGPDGFDESEERLLFARRDPVLSRAASDALEALACLRPPPTNDPGFPR
jgi:tRNA A-37 threonylcarbamoyl transferase component Bud32/tetratricopeptide (TPR) repeat protein